MSGVDVLTGEIVDRLTDADLDDFDRLETIVTFGLGSFVEVGAALQEIRDRGLYRDRFGSFTEYMDRAWQLSQSRAYQMIDAAIVVHEISTIVETAPDGSPLRSTPIPQNEAQARELTRFKGNPELAAAVLREAEKDGAPTAKNIKAAVRKSASETTVPTRKPPPAEGEKKDPRLQAIADAAERYAQNLQGIDLRHIEEKTVKRLEAICRRWREQTHGS